MGGDGEERQERTRQVADRHGLYAVVPQRYQPVLCPCQLPYRTALPLQELSTKRARTVGQLDVTRPFQPKQLWHARPKDVEVEEAYPRWPVQVGRLRQRQR